MAQSGRRPLVDTYTRTRPMAHFRTLPGHTEPGFDPDRFLQVLPVHQTRTLYLFAGADLDVSVEDTTLATIDTQRSATDRKSTRLNSSHANISYAVFC